MSTAPASGDTYDIVLSALDEFREGISRLQIQNRVAEFFDVFPDYRVFVQELDKPGNAVCTYIDPPETDTGESSLRFELTARFQELLSALRTFM
jgi:hypothetical protein